ncbi:hypothetical protein J6590_080387 [Homalodisca vitripennis]|nr:hypothetical protein J6590_101950 [Homalodisca vitripennis]KAG8261152.1 hypothetical protein J6590_080387 [Homalodisca vitripennis]
MDIQYGPCSAEEYSIPVSFIPDIISALRHVNSSIKYQTILYHGKTTKFRGITMLLWCNQWLGTRGGTMDVESKENFGFGGNLTSAVMTLNDVSLDTFESGDLVGLTLSDVSNVFDCVSPVPDVNKQPCALVPSPNYALLMGQDAGGRLVGARIAESDLQ